jgi:hypothetical protein
MRSSKDPGVDPRTISKRWISRSGNKPPVYFDVRVNNITKKNNAHIGRVIAFRDITERVELFQSGARRWQCRIA